jgi:ABC-2 type transport system permease protein
VSARASWEVARWEFHRFFKWKQHVAGALITIAGGLAAFGLFSLGRGGPNKQLRLAVITDSAVTVPVSDESDIHITIHAGAEEARLRRAVERGELDGLLIHHDQGPSTLVVERTPMWRGRVEHWLTAARTRARLAERGLEPSELARIVEPVELRVTELAPPRLGRSALIAAMMAVAVMILAVFSGVTYVFASITGEKQSRVTEQLLACMPPQSWMDGKILGLAFVTFASVLNMLASGFIVLLAFRALGASMTLPLPLDDPLTVVLVLLFAFLGFAFWFTFMAAVAATIDDPNTSTRGPLLFLPALASGAGTVSALQPDSLAGVLLALLPPTSATAMPARLLVADVPAWEIALAALLLLGASYALRSIAGRIFALGVLMYGKEPSWSELRRWIRET